MWLKLKQFALASLLINSVAVANDNAGIFSLDKDECIILVASTKSETEARTIAKKYPGSDLYTSRSGYIAVGLEKISKQQSALRIKELLSTGKIPKGSNCADGTRITGLLNADGRDALGNAKANKNSAGEGTEQASKTSGRGLTGPQKNAARKAKQYLSIKGFSREGLIAQLVFEEFDESDSAVAIDSMNIDWNEQAARSAKSYLDLMGFSCGGLIQQLTSVADRFTIDEARYGAQKAGGC